jgi:hypothetical protein
MLSIPLNMMPIGAVAVAMEERPARLARCPADFELLGEGEAAGSLEVTLPPSARPPSDLFGDAGVIGRAFTRIACHGVEALCRESMDSMRPDLDDPTLRDRLRKGAELLRTQAISDLNVAGRRLANELAPFLDELAEDRAQLLRDRLQAIAAETDDDGFRVDQLEKLACAFGLPRRRSWGLILDRVLAPSSPADFGIDAPRSIPLQTHEALVELDQRERHVKLLLWPTGKSRPVPMWRLLVSIPAGHLTNAAAIRHLTTEVGTVFDAAWREVCRRQSQLTCLLFMVPQGGAWFPGAGPHTISLGSALPDVSKAITTIDASGQVAWACQLPKVVSRDRR